jgi:hypothetical protein
LRRGHQSSLANRFSKELSKVASRWSKLAALLFQVLSAEC